MIYATSVNCTKDKEEVSQFLSETKIPFRTIFCDTSTKSDWTLIADMNEDEYLLVVLKFPYIWKSNLNNRSKTNG